MKNVEAIVKAMVAGGVGDRVRVKVYEQKTVSVAIHAITLRKADGTLVAPQNVPTAAELKAALDAIWCQACVSFNVVEGKTMPVAYDVDGDGKLKDAFEFPECPLVTAAAYDAGMWANVYYVPSLASGSAGHQMADRVYMGTDVADPDRRVAAHELGHRLILGTDYDHVNAPTNLMHLAYPPGNRLLKWQWDMANP